VLVKVGSYNTYLWYWRVPTPQDISFTFDPKVLKELKGPVTISHFKKLHKIWTHINHQKAVHSGMVVGSKLYVKKFRGCPMENSHKKCTSQLRVLPEDKQLCNGLKVFFFTDCDGTPFSEMTSSFGKSTTTTCLHYKIKSYWPINERQKTVFLFCLNVNNFFCLVVAEDNLSGHIITPHGNTM
jgi:hypothetical protein